MARAWNSTVQASHRRSVRGQARYGPNEAEGMKGMAAKRQPRKTRKGPKATATRQDILTTMRALEGQVQQLGDLYAALPQGGSPRSRLSDGTIYWRARYRRGGS